MATIDLACFTSGVSNRSRGSAVECRVTINIDEMRGYTFSFVFSWPFHGHSASLVNGNCGIYPAKGEKRDERKGKREREREMKSRTAWRSDGRTETEENRA